jgi:hypothetical protein
MQENQLKYNVYSLDQINNICVSNQLLWLKSWCLAQKLVFPPKHCRGVVYVQVAPRNGKKT